MFAATLVAGPATAELIYSDAGLGVNIDEKCAISGNVADCVAVGVVDGTTVTAQETESAVPIEVQGSLGNNAVVPSPTPSGGNSASSPAKTPSAGPQASGGPAATGSDSSGSPSPSAQSNGASAVLPRTSSLIGAILMFSGVFAL